VTAELRRRLPDATVDHVIDDGETILVHVVASTAAFARTAADLETAAAEVAHALKVERSFLLEVASGWRK
jgi:hypothetical protein